MANYGWAYTTGAISGSGGISGSLQWRNGPSEISGNENLVWDNSESTLYVTGNLNVNGILYAEEFHVDTVLRNVVDISSTGSTAFGDSVDDHHLFVGKVMVANTASAENVGARLHVHTVDTDNIKGMFIDHDETGNYYALQVDSENTTTDTIYASGWKVANLVQDIDDGYGLVVSRNQNDAGTFPLVTFTDDHATNSQTTLKIQQDGTGDILNLFDGSTEVFTVIDGGNVGIGLDAPQSKLHIEHTDTTPWPASVGVSDEEYSDFLLTLRNNTNTEHAFAGIAFDVTSETDADSIGASICGVADNTTSTAHDTNLVFATNDAGDDGLTERMRITHDGLVGIGVLDPDSLLEIFGTSTKLKLSYDTTNYSTFDVGATGNLTITTVDPDAEEADLTLTLDGAFDVNANQEVAIDSTAASITVGAVLADGQTLKLGKNGAVEMVLTPHGTAADEKFLLTNTAGTADDAIKMTSVAGGVTIHAGNDSMIFDADGTDTDAINIDSAGGIDVDAVGAISLDSSGGSIDINVVDGQTVSIGLNGGVEQIIAPHGSAGSELYSVINTSGTTDGADAAGAILLSSVAGGIGLAWADDKDLWAEGGRAVITANEDAADCIKLHADAGTSQTITVVNDAGTNAAAIGLTATAGGITLTSAATTAVEAVTITASQTTKDVLQITADNCTTARVIDITADSLTTGAALYIDDNSDETDTRNTVEIIQNHVSAIAATALKVQSDGGITGIELDKNFASTTAATVTGLFIDMDKTGASSSNNTINGLKVDLDNATATDGVNQMFGIDVSATLTHASDAGTPTVQGGKIHAVGSTNGTATAKGLTISTLSAETQVGLEVQTLGGTTHTGVYINNADGGKDLQIVSSANVNDYFTIAVGAEGATTFTTVDAGTTAANLTFTVDGDIILGPAGGDVLPDADNTRNLGSASYRWANLYTGDLHLKNDRGDWTILEEEDYLCVINNKNGKKYKMMLEEVD